MHFRQLGACSAAHRDPASTTPIVEPKDKTRERLGRSPDDADALLLAYYSPPGDPGSALDWIKAARAAA